MADEEESENEESGGLIKRSGDGSSLKWCREGTLELVLPLMVLAVLSVGVLVYNMFRKWDICDENLPMAKHFYCYNASMSPGFHLDKD